MIKHSIRLFSAVKSIKDENKGWLMEHSLDQKEQIFKIINKTLRNKGNKEDLNHVQSGAQIMSLMPNQMKKELFNIEQQDKAAVGELSLLGSETVANQLKRVIFY